MTFRVTLVPLALSLTLVIVSYAGIPAGSLLTNPVVPAFSASVSATPSYGAKPLLVSFQALASSGSPSSYSWSFGDGTFYNGTNTSAADPSHWYYTPGSYNATVVMFEGSSSGSASVTVHVVSQLLSAHVSATGHNGSAPLTLRFNSTVSGGTGTYVNFSWTFGDGGSGSGLSILYTFLHPGTYHVILTVHDSGNASTSAGVWVNATPPKAPATSPWILLYDLAPWLGGGVLAGVLVWAIRRTLRPLTSEARMPPPVEDMSTWLEGNAASGPPMPSPTIPISSGTATVSSRESRRVPTNDSPIVSQRVILHLANQGRLGSDEVAPATFTQGGMAAALMIPQNSLTNALRRLVAGGVLTEDTRHVRGRDRRLKVYRLTARGEELAQELRSRR